MKRSKLIALTLSGVLALSSAAILAGCGGNSKAGADTTFTWYLTAGEDGYYSDYEDNPVIEYIMENMQFEGSDGEMKNIAFDFFQPTTTENARSEFNQKYMSGNWEDVIDPTMSRGITDMYEAGVVADLTPYITDRELMPNLNAYLDAHPEYRSLMQTQTKDGAKYLSIPTFKDSISYESQSFGFNYRRDLLVRYGVQPDEFYDPMTDEAPTANPKAGQKFQGHYTVNLDGSERSDPMSQDTTLPEGANGQSWVDDVTFPSGHSDPVYISDWMWMFETYETAYAAMGIEPEYMMSLFYPGYNANGDLSSGFGGGGVLWYKDEDDNCQFGAAGTGFRAYLECMNDWYSRGWVCNTFNEDTSPFYQIDLDLVANGTVPLWMGGSNFGTAIQSSETGLRGSGGRRCVSCGNAHQRHPRLRRQPLDERLLHAGDRRRGKRSHERRFGQRIYAADPHLPLSGRGLFAGRRHQQGGGRGQRYGSSHALLRLFIQRRGLCPHDARSQCRTGRRQPLL